MVETYNNNDSMPILSRGYTEDERKSKDKRAVARAFISSETWRVMSDFKKIEFLKAFIKYFPETSLELPALKKELENLKFNLGVE